MRFTTIFLLLTLLLTQLECFAQIEIRGETKILTDRVKTDSVNQSPNRDFEKRIKLKPIDKSKNDIEVRFYIHESLSSTRKLQIISLKDSIWQGTMFKESNYPKVKIRKSELKAENGFEEVFKMLLMHNINSLPDQEDLDSKMKKYTTLNGKKAEDKILVSDGQSYTVEIKIGDKFFRVYRYHNPKSYADFYSNVQELKDFVAIINVFENELEVQ